MPERIARAAVHVAAGGLLALPTDTVYGLGVRADDAAAVCRLLAAKGRGRTMPPPVLIADGSQLDGVVARVPDAARALVEAFWPGALTLVLEAAPNLDWDLGDTGGTIAVRMPDHPLALALLHATGPMAVTSANATGQPPATDAAGVRAAFPGRVGDADTVVSDAVENTDILLLDGGPTPGPVPSTIVSLVGPAAWAPEVLREGVISREELERLGT
ncbi:L-threonylcarbamoyladenylate synthase [Actinomyces sp.]|uniref:L-threonylcarbamoyladenylate synthase n=1 Tax=Actinomyces sp. TaxID=29317 RepID=UPI0026DD4CD9|nr:L-threonylcarbamoyladenylate synthase [Actinomyces sp.]MDO4900295.1 L-threonylcarbamoyladenylate synthase [Actinomyces sp.]